MVSFVRPEDSPTEIERMTGCAEAALQMLGLAYRVRLLSTLDMGFTQAKTYDIEVWAPGVQEWLEVSSVSNFRDFQARRMNIRYRPEPGAKPEILHTLNGSSLGFPRTFAALLENYQQADGSVALPEPLASSGRSAQLAVRFSSAQVSGRRGRRRGRAAEAICRYVSAERPLTRPSFHAAFRGGLP